MKSTTRSEILSAGCVVIGLLASVSHVSTQVSRAPALIGRLAGIWKEDLTQRRVGGLATLLFQRNASGALEELRGGPVRPVTQPVVFDGKPHDVEGGNRVAWRQTGPNTFERLLLDGRTGSGRVLSTRRLELSADGKTLTEQFERKNADGATSTDTTTYTRAVGEGKDLTGEWRAQSVSTSPAPILKNEVVDHGLKIVDVAGDRTRMISLDGTPGAVLGPAVIHGTMSVSKLLDDHTVEFTESRGGVTTATVKWVLSADAKTLTETRIAMTPSGPTMPSTSVYRKQ